MMRIEVLPGGLQAQVQAGLKLPSWPAEVGKCSPTHQLHHHHQNDQQLPDAQLRQCWGWGRATLRLLSWSPRQSTQQSWKMMMIAIMRWFLLVRPNLSSSGFFSRGGRDCSHRIPHRLRQTHLTTMLCSWLCPLVTISPPSVQALRWQWQWQRQRQRQRPVRTNHGFLCTLTKTETMTKTISSHPHLSKPSNANDSNSLSPILSIPISQWGEHCDSWFILWQTWYLSQPVRQAVA